MGVTAIRTEGLTKRYGAAAVLDHLDPAAAGAHPPDRGTRGDLGADMFGPAGERVLSLGLLDLYSHQLISTETAAAAEAGLDAPPG